MSTISSRTTHEIDKSPLSILTATALRRPNNNNNNNNNPLSPGHEGVDHCLQPLHKTEQLDTHTYVKRYKKNEVYVRPLALKYHFP